MLTKLIRIAAAVLFILIAAIIVYFFKFRYDYYGNVSVKEAMKYADLITSKIDSYFLRHDKFPHSLSEIGLPDDRSGFTPKISIDSITGVLTITISNTEGEYGILEYIPSLSKDKHMIWNCRNISISDNYLPSECT